MPVRPTSAASAAGATADGRRLLIASPTFWPEPVGTPKYVLDSARWFADRGWRVAVVTAQPFYPDFALYDGWGGARDRDEVDGIPILRMPTVIPRGGAAHWRMASDLNFAAQVLVRGLQRTVPQPDAILSFSPGVPFVVPAAAFGRRLRHVCIVHDLQTGLASTTGMAPKPVLRAMGAVEAKALSRADELLALSPAMADSLRALGVTSPVDVAPIWSDVPIVDRVRPTPRGDRATLVYSGNLGRKQGVPILVDVAERLRDRGVAATLVLRGRGQMRAEVEAEVARRGLHDVVLEDFVPAEHLQQRLGEATLHLVPQLPGTGGAAMPSKVITILASGRPLLAICDEGDPLHDLSRRGAALWAAVDGDAAADRICHALANPAELDAIAARGLQIARAEHDRDAVLGRVEAKLAGLPLPVPATTPVAVAGADDGDALTRAA